MMQNDGLWNLLDRGTASRDGYDAWVGVHATFPLSLFGVRTFDLLSVMEASRRSESEWQGLLNEVRLGKVRQETKEGQRCTQCDVTHRLSHRDTHQLKIYAGQPLKWLVSSVLQNQGTTESVFNLPWMECGWGNSFTPIFFFFLVAKTRQTVA